MVIKDSGHVNCLVVDFESKDSCHVKCYVVPHPFIHRTCISIRLLYFFLLLCFSIYWLEITVSSLVISRPLSCLASPGEPDWLSCDSKEFPCRHKPQDKLARQLYSEILECWCTEIQVSLFIRLHHATMLINFVTLWTFTLRIQLLWICNESSVLYCRCWLQIIWGAYAMSSSSLSYRILGCFHPVIIRT